MQLLHIEDDADIRDITKMALDLHGGFTLLQAHSGEDALRLAPDFRADVMVLDVMMPGLNGPQTLAALRQLAGYEQTPAIFMTARVQTGGTEDLIRAGGIGVIEKPFDPITLGDQIIGLIGQ